MNEIKIVLMGVCVCVFKLTLLVCGGYVALIL